MLRNLPRRHRAALAAGIGLVMVIMGTWASTLVGEPRPAGWGVALGTAAGVLLALAVLRLRDPARPARVTRGRGAPPALR
jgi:hypothetical protein